MNILNFKENITSLISRLQNDLTLSKECEGHTSFIDASRKLAKEFYGYFHCSTRGASVNSLIDIQAELELSDKNMKDFELYSRTLLNVTFTLRALGIEVEKIQKSIQLVYDEIFEFWTAAKGIESQNYKIIKILTQVWRILRDLKESIYVLSRHQKLFIEKNLQPSIISFSNYIECSKNEELNSLLKSFGSKTMYFAETLRQMKYLNELILNHQKLKSIHPMFSFQLILMINDPRITLDDYSTATARIQTKDANKMLSKCSCCSRARKPKGSENVPVIRSPEIVFNLIETQAIQIGTTIHRTTRDVREVHCASLRREEIVLTEVQAKRMMLLRGIGELQNIMTILEDMDDCNDTLVGKMVKTRPMFKYINESLKFDLSNIGTLPETTATSTQDL